MTETFPEITLPISGMTCASCVSHVEGALKDLPGISNVTVNLATNKANLSYDPQRVKLDDMRRAVEDVGYAITTVELTLDVRGMTCASCVEHVESALKELRGVQDAVVNLGLNTARVTYIPGVVSTSSMKRAVREVGMAIGSGTDVAKETGDVILIKDDIRDVVVALEVAKATMRKVRQNLFWAFVYNTLGIPLGAGLFYPFISLIISPELAGLLMAVSSVSVTLNTLLLKGFKPSVGREHKSARGSGTKQLQSATASIGND